MRTLCDVCESAAAVVFCAADEAALCHSCDDKVHTCNKLASRHVRVRLANPKDVPRCDICEKEAAFFYCEIDGTSLCLQCDMAVHVGGKRSHGRYLLLRQHVQFEDSSASKSTDPVQTVRAMDSEPPVVLASTPLPLGDEPVDTKVIDLNSNPRRLLETTSNHQQ